jgi:NADPH-dependent curcumin reductase CurA
MRGMTAYVAPLIAAGKFKYREDIRQALEAIPASFGEMSRGDNFGKMLVQPSPDPTLGQA